MPEHEVTLFERNPAGATYGWGVVFSDRTLTSFREADFRTYSEIVDRFIIWDAIDVRYRDAVVRCGGQVFSGIARRTLLELLTRRCEELDVTLEFEREIDGPAELESFDLIVAADGVHSGLRARLLPHVRAPLYHWGCMWTTVPDLAGIGAAGLLRQRVRGTQLMMGLLPVGRNEVTMYWSLPIRALGRSKTIDLAAWRRTATALWPEAGAIIDRAAAGDFARATYRHVALSHWNAGPVLFIGDAAHGTSPQLGQGANLGLMDAWVLTQTLDDAPELLSAFLRFERRRNPSVRYYRRASHLLTPFFQSRLAPLGWLRDAFMGPAHHVPGLRSMMGSTLAGTRRGWFSATTLGDDGCFPLDV